MPFDPEKLDLYPLQPGVYLMKNSTGHVLYVGKANNLRQRLKQYFFPGRDGRMMVPFLVQKIEEVDVIVVSSEKEALLLENNLIKQYKPRFNALLKDDKSSVALKITYKDKWPMLQLVRYRGVMKNDGLYFGPYASAISARTTFDLLNRVFPLRQCSDQEFARRTRPCILYEMKRCIAPCVGKCTKEEYDRHVERTIKFLKGADKEVLEQLYGDMHKASELLEFEKAAQILRTIRRLEASIEGQKVDKPWGKDVDALAVFREGEDVVVNQLVFRAGKLTSSYQYDFSHIAQDNTELLHSFMLQHYEGKELLPSEILLPEFIPEVEAVAELLSKGRAHKIVISTPVKGDKKALVEMAYKNAEAAFKKDKDVQQLRQRMLLQMKEKFHLKNYPRRIECFDNSHLSGSEPVSSLVVFTDGEKDSRHYRQYKIKASGGLDDYAGIYEVVFRRCKRGKEEGVLPDLIIVDGGKGQLNAALKALQELEIVTVDVIGVAKEEGRHDKGITAERVFLKDVKDPVILRHTSPVLFLLQQVRDEAHRTAILFHRKQRTKRVIRSSLDDIPGIGPAKRKLLLMHFGSIKGIENATEEELLQLKKISKVDVARILSHFKNE